MKTTRKILCTLATLAASSLLAGCGGRSDDPDAGATTVATATVGAAGGTVAAADGRIALTIPAGALGNPTEIVIKELSGAAIPVALRSSLTERLYQLEPSGTRFATPARASIRLPRGAPGDWVAMALIDASGAGMPRRQSIDEVAGALVLEADVAHFSHLVVSRRPGPVASITPNPALPEFGQTVRLDILISGMFDETFFLSYDGATDTQYTGSIAFSAFGENPPEVVFGRDQFVESRGHEFGRCVGSGRGTVKFNYRMTSPIAAAFYFPYLSVGVEQAESQVSRWAYGEVECGQPAGFILAGGIFALPGVTAPDGISVFAGPFAGIPGGGPFAAVAGSNGFKVFDLVTLQPVLDRTQSGPDGATVGTNLIGVVPFAASASASAPAGVFGFGNDQGAQQQWDPGSGWGGTFLELRRFFDTVTAGNGLATRTVVKVSPSIGVSFSDYDETQQAFRPSARFAALTSFAGARELVSAQMPEDGGGLLVMSRDVATGTGSRVYHQPFDTALPSQLLHVFSRNDARRLRCAKFGTKQVCAATMFDGAEVKLFSFDPAAPAATPPVLTLPVGAGALGVAVTARPNGNAAIVVTNFGAGSINVIEVTADLATVVSNTTVPVPAGCTSPGHPAWVVDRLGLVAVYTCNGSHNAVAHRPFG